MENLVLLYLFLLKVNRKQGYNVSLERSLNMSSTKNNTQVWLVVSAFCFKKSLRVLEHKGRSY